jgi:hypothetical protein
VRVFRPTVMEGSEWVIPADAAAHGALHDLDGTPKRNSWAPIRVEFVHDDEMGNRYAYADLPWMGTDVLVMRPRAVEAVAPLLDGFGEFLDLACDEDALRLFNVTHVVDVLDEQQSEIARFSSGGVLNIERHAFDVDGVRRERIFKIPQTRDIYATDLWVRHVRPLN